MSSILISADDIKKEIPGYVPERSGEFHELSAKMADRRFDECLKSSDYQKVILMSGGPASGKTEFVSEYLMDKNFLIYDGILPTEKGAKIKIEHASKAGKEVSIYAVWPGDLKQAYAAFLNRDRKFNDAHFYEKHASARKTLLWIAENKPKIEIRLYKNLYVEDELTFTELEFFSRDQLVAYLKDNQYNKEDIVKFIIQ